jgi:hypothetical protein
MYICINIYTTNITTNEPSVLKVDSLLQYIYIHIYIFIYINMYIYAGKISLWNDPIIKAANPTTASLLPNQQVEVKCI